LAGLSKQQQMQLAELLSLVANHQGLISAAPSKSERPKEANTAICAAGTRARRFPSKARPPVRPAPSEPSPAHPPCADDCFSAETTRRT
jgi:hypothetical protein